MAFTKTEIIVLKLFTAKPLESFTIREVSRLTKKDLKIIHTSIKKLLEKNFLIKNKHNSLRLNYQNNIQDLAYIENIKKKDFFQKYQLIKIHIKKFLQKTSKSFFILIIFGSFASNKQTKTSDIDLLAIIPRTSRKFNKQLKASLSTSTTKFDINIINKSSFKEMLKKRDEINIINECLNNHIILYGAEQYYSLLKQRHIF